MVPSAPPKLPCRPLATRFPRGSRPVLAAQGRLVSWGLCGLLLLLVGGCRSQAQQDVYTDKMASRIRVLEDQLNTLDYENSVLRQELSRARAGADRRDGNRGSRDERGDSRGSGLRGSYGDDLPGTDYRSASPRSEFGDDDALDTPDLDMGIDLGSPLPPPSMEDAPELSIGEPGAVLREDTSGIEIPGVDDGRDVDDAGGTGLKAGSEAGAGTSTGPAMPPVQALPPRREDLLPPPIEQGEPLPPALESDQPRLPMGQIQTPDSARALFPQPPNPPVEVRLHPGLTGPHRQNSDDEIDGVYLTLSALDAGGQPTETSGVLTVAVLDPQREGSEARLGRWDFTDVQVAASRRTHPIPSWQIPVLWQGKRPLGDQVAVFVRLTLPDGERLETDLMLQLDQPRVTDWQPQGLGTPHLERRATGFAPEVIWR